MGSESQATATAAASFGVRTRQSQEMQDVAMNEPLLREMAAMTGGKFYRLDQARQLADDLKFLQRREQVTLELEVWDTPWWFLAFCALIITEWAVRKWKGLV